MSTPHRVKVALPEANSRGYEVLVGSGLFANLASILSRFCPAHRYAVVTDDRVAELYAVRLSRMLHGAGYRTDVFAFTAGEEQKNRETWALVSDAMLEAGCGRDTALIAFGGGVPGDLGGFVAATYMRGLPLVQVPTSLLAMVDASVGGKTGVNHAVGKNLIGAFHQPIAVLADPETLKTLPARELSGGLAECIKHDIIRDRAGFYHLRDNVRRALALDIDYLSELVAHNVAIKAKVVEADPSEKAERAHLNFGHTFGHAIETVSRYSYAHGECVALGMVAASRLASDLGMMKREEADQVREVIDRAGLPTGGMQLSTNDVLDAMIFDKKVKAGRLRFVLPTGIGQVVIRDDVAPELVRKAVESLR